MKRASLVVALLSLLAQAGSATEWNVMGARAMGMGGTGVAASEGPIGEYWNPASLGRPESPSGAQIPVIAHAELTGQAIEGANDLHNVINDCQKNPPGPLCNLTNITAAVNELRNPNDGLRTDAAAGLQTKIKKLAVFVNNMAYVSAVPYVDSSHVSINNIQQNNSALILRGLDVTEIGAGYGRELPWVPGLFVGGNLKLLVGKAGYYNLNLVQNSAGGINKFLDNAQTSMQPGVDLGALWDVNRTLDFVPFHPRIGITSRNINDPQFSNPDQAKLAGVSSTYSLHGNTRVGAVITPLDFWNIAADADLTRNLTAVSGVASQYVGLGTEVNVFNRSWLNLPLRFGLARNIAEPGAKTSLTGGFGLNFLHFMVDAAGMVSPSTVQIQSTQNSQKIPANLAASVQVGMLFGGGPQEEKKSE
jgi:hypothetical protein